MIKCNPVEFTPDAKTTFDLIVLIVAVCCMLLILYGMCKFCVVSFNPDKHAHSNRCLVAVGMLYLTVSAFTTMNAILFDILYILCPILYQWEGPIFHTVYFAELYLLWLFLFLRLYYVFTPTTDFQLEHQLSRCSVIAWAAIFILIPCAIVPLYFVFHFEAERYVPLPYVVVSVFVLIALLTTFVYKLRELIHDGIGTDPPSSMAHRRMLALMTKSTLLAGFSILGSLSAMVVFLVLQITHNGFDERYNEKEHLVLELFILLDTVSDILCVLLSYTFFDAEYRLICTCCDKWMADYFRTEINERVSKCKLANDPCTLAISPEGDNDTDAFEETEDSLMRGEGTDLLTLRVHVNITT